MYLRTYNVSALRISFGKWIFKEHSAYLHTEVYFHSKTLRFVLFCFPFVRLSAFYVSFFRQSQVSPERRASKNN